MATKSAWEEYEEEKLRRDNVGKWLELRDFYYNKAKQEIIGRNPTQWLRFFGLYFGLYLSLCLMLIVLLAFALVAMDDINPYRQGTDSPLQWTPGLAMRPVPDFQTELIRFVQGKAQSYKPFADHIRTFLEQYENEAQVGENFISCIDGRPENSLDKVCRFDVDTLGEFCTWQRDYGYDEGQPCILLKLNRIFSWLPELYPASERPESVPADRYHEEYIGITCEGEEPADRENIGDIVYNPPNGFPKYFYPYLNQEGYRSPLVMVNFRNPMNGVLINVVCKAWAKNIRFNRNDQLGMIRFQLLVD